MINPKSLSQFEWLERNQLVKPIYRDYSFGNIAATIFYLLAKEKIGNLLPKDCFFDGVYPHPKKIVLFLIDGFGFDSWQKNYKKFKLLRKTTEKGIVTPISALFPSTTAASVTTLNLGVLPSQHALYEWTLYIEKYSETIQTLIFSPLGEKKVDECFKKGYNPKHLLKLNVSLYQRLGRLGVKSYWFNHQDYSHSAYTKLFKESVVTFSFSKTAEGLVNLRNLIEENKEPMLINFYYGDIDSVGHKYGPNSPQHQGQVAEFWLTLEYVFANFKKEKDTLFLFTADHGQTCCHPKNTFYLNLEIPQIKDFLKKTKKGKIIYPNGSPRDVFLHVKENKTEKLLKTLQKKLKEKALVMTTKEALALGLFGPPPFDDEFLKRLGQILILPYRNNYVWWYEKDKLESKYFGHHGGLTQEEIATVFAIF